MTRATSARGLHFHVHMYSGGSLFLIAIGAILYWAVTLQVPWVNLHMVGFILMVLGAVGLLFSIIASATSRHRLS